MKAILEFNLPDEVVEFRSACKGADAVCVIESIIKQTRDWLKYGHEFKTANDALEEIRKFIYEELEDYTDKIVE